MQTPSRGLTASIHHSGAHVADANEDCALRFLTFHKAGQYNALKLEDVPPVMLAECWADYHAFAAKGAFRADWEKVCPW